MITTLLNAGANINLANRSGFTPLHHAGEAGSKEAATLLIAKGANLTLRNMHDQTAEQTARASHHPDVAVSACESGISDLGQRSDEFFGLPMALLAGGASAVVGTEWPAVDFATALLVDRFYALHLGGQEFRSPAAALRTAQLWLRDASAETLRAYVTQAFIEKRVSSADAAWLRDQVLGPYPPNTRPFADPAFWANFTVTGL